VAGPALPRFLAKIGDVLLGPAAEGEHPAVSSGLSMAVEKYSHFTHSESVTQVTGECWMRIWVDAESESEAQDIVAETWAPQVAAALTLANRGIAYRIQVIGVKNPGENGISWSPGLAMRLWDDVPMEAPALEQMALYLEASVRSPTVRTADQLLMRGQHFQDSSAHPMFKAAAVFSFHQAIERIAASIRVSKPEDLSSRQASVIKKLQQSLKMEVKLTRQIEAVRKANDEFGRLDARFATLKLENAARTLKMPDEWLAGALALTEFRNKRLGHGGQLASVQELEPWFESDTQREGRAFELAADLIHAMSRYEVYGAP
jgi:hypothetical protein